MACSQGCCRSQPDINWHSVAENTNTKEKKKNKSPDGLTSSSISQECGKAVQPCCWIALIHCWMDSRSEWLFQRSSLFFMMICLINDATSGLILSMSSSGLQNFTTLPSGLTKYFQKFHRGSFFEESVRMVLDHFSDSLTLLIVSLSCSDSSAIYFEAILPCSFLEIWTWS